MPIQESSFSSTNTKELPAPGIVFKKILSTSTHYARFHFLFLGFLGIQTAALFLFFPSLNNSIIGPFAVAIFLLSLFSYFVLIPFMRIKKSGDFNALAELFFSQWKNLYKDEEDINLLHRQIAHNGITAASFIAQEEYSLYTKKFPIKSLHPLVIKLRIKLHWKSFLLAKELFFLGSIEALIALVKLSPRTLETHALLAEAYGKLSELYLHPSKASSSPLPWIPAAYLSPTMQEKFILAAERAVQELTILQDYSEGDPWIHAKLAEIYHLTDNKEKEIQEYEKILETSTTDELVLFRLGVLYFSQGQNAKGLGIYEKLQEMGSKKTAPLISYYDTFSFYEKKEHFF